VESHFADTYYPTIENTFTKIIKHRNVEYAAEIIDTAGQDEYSILNSRHAIGIHGYVLTYSIASRSSFEMCSIIRDKILNYTGLDWVPIVLGKFKFQSVVPFHHYIKKFYCQLRIKRIFKLRDKDKFQRRKDVNWQRVGRHHSWRRVQRRAQILRGYLNSCWLKLRSRVGIRFKKRRGLETA
jgi:hypothetical protein